MPTSVDVVIKILSCTEGGEYHLPLIGHLMGSASTLNILKRRASPGIWSHKFCNVSRPRQPIPTAHVEGDLQSNYLRVGVQLIGRNYKDKLGVKSILLNYFNVIGNYESWRERKVVNRKIKSKKTKTLMQWKITGTWAPMWMQNYLEEHGGSLWDCCNRLTLDDEAKSL